MKRVLALLALTLLFTACEPVSDPVSEPEVPVDNTVTLDNSYAITCPEFSKNVPKGMFWKVCQAVREFCPDVTIQDDFYKEESEIAEKEILIGPTNRPESHVEFVDQDEFVVKMTNGKLVINAANTVALDAACAWFCNRIQTEGLSFAADFCYVGNLEGAEEKLLLVADQAGNRAAVLNIGRGYAEEKALWQVYPKNGSNIAGLKYRKTDKYGEVVLLAYWNSATMYEYPSGKVLWKASSYAAENPHSIEISPDGRIIAVASSTGGEVRFYNTDGKPRQYTSVPLSDAHGVLYDPEYEWFWMISGSSLVAYTAEIAEDGSILVAEVPGKIYTPKRGGLHDLQPYAGDNNKLWVAAWDTVYVFDKEKGTFSISYDNKNQINRPHVKGISQFPDGTTALVFPDGDRQGWTSPTILCSYYLPFAETEVFLTVKLPENTHIYKLRAFISDYQY